MKQIVSVYAVLKKYFQKDFFFRIPTWSMFTIKVIKCGYNCQKQECRDLFKTYFMFNNVNDFAFKFKSTYVESAERNSCETLRRYPHEFRKLCEFGSKFLLITLKQVCRSS